MTEFETISRVRRRQHAEVLADRYRDMKTEDVLRALVRTEFYGSISVVSSFGADSAVLLHMVANIDPYVPVIFLDTGKHFPETLAYRDHLCDALGLHNIQRVTPSAALLAAEDEQGTLHESDPDLCCTIRKTRPMMMALRGVACWISGRKRFQNFGRSGLDLFEADDRWIKVNPLFNWTQNDLDAYFAHHRLPRHPLVDRGYASIGCACCTRPVEPGEDARAGRWAGMSKTECGIHHLTTGHTDQPPYEVRSLGGRYEKGGKSD